jgi:hypothetical protein
MAKGSDSSSLTLLPAGEHISTSETMRPPASSRNGQAFKAFDVTPPPQAFASSAGRPSKSATRAPPRANLSAAKDPAGPAPTINTSKISPPLKVASLLILKTPPAPTFAQPFVPHPRLTLRDRSPTVLES